MGVGAMHFDRPLFENRPRRDTMLHGGRIFVMEARISSVRGTKIGGALIPLLVVALLLCHGALGTVHQLLLVDPSPIAGHLSLADSPAEQEDDRALGADAEDLGYYAVGFLLSLGAFFWSRLNRACKADPARHAQVAGPLPRSVALGRRHGPTVVLLRVLRL